MCEGSFAKQVKSFNNSNEAKLCGPDAFNRFALYKQSIVTYFEILSWCVRGISTAVNRGFISKPDDRLTSVSWFDPGFCIMATLNISKQTWCASYHCLCDLSGANGVGSFVRTKRLFCITHWLVFAGFSSKSCARKQ